MKIFLLVSIMCLTTCWPATVLNKGVLKSCNRPEVAVAAPDNVTLINPFFLIN
jgi:hypothetical protein